MRLLTRSDFDGLACAVFLKEADVIDSWRFVHPKDVQDRNVEVSANDVLANVPFIPGCGLWFDHHSSEAERVQIKGQFKGDSRPAPSAAHVIWDYFGGEKKFGRFKDLLNAVDRSDTADFTLPDVGSPTGWVLLSFVMDPRTGLGRFKSFRLSNYDLMEKLIDWCREMDIGQILAQPDVKERADLYFAQQELFQKQLKERSRAEGNVIVLDLRNQPEIHAGSRFTIYTLYPKQNISIHVLDGKNRQNIVFACGHSIFNKTAHTDIGSLMLKYGGGGHRTVGTCQVNHADAERVLQELIQQMKDDG